MQMWRLDIIMMMRISLLLLLLVARCHSRNLSELRSKLEEALLRDTNNLYKLQSLLFPPQLHYGTVNLMVDLSIQRIIDDEQPCSCPAPFVYSNESSWYEWPYGNGNLVFQLFVDTDLHTRLKVFITSDAVKSMMVLQDYVMFKLFNYLTFELKEGESYHDDSLCFCDEGLDPDNVDTINLTIYELKEMPQDHYVVIKEVSYLLSWVSCVL